MSSILGRENLDRYQPGIKKKKSRQSIIIRLAIGILGGFFLSTILFSLHTMPNSAMSPLLKKKQKVLFLSFFPAKRGDIVLVSPPGQKGKGVVRKVAAIEGDRVTVKRGIVMVNGKETDYMVTPKGYRFPGKPDDMELTVKKENIFLVSIQTGHFYDSRMWGTVSKDSIRGVSIYPAD